MIVNRLLGKILYGHKVRLRYRYYSTSKSSDDNIRNIAILAHIDAGKTTTTERMLYYSGKTHTMGEVHRGNTITDFLAQERERGITICSAAVTLPWKDHRINLLDTPGHIDFTMEVEQSLGAVDGVVVVLDSSAGVEAQTITVWHQADHYKLPRMVFANKMDRPDADFEGCLDDLEKKLECIPVPIQLPIMGDKGIKSIIDVLELKELRFDQSKEGRVYAKVPLSGELLRKTVEKRCEIIDLMSSYDDKLADQIIQNDSLETIDSSIVRQAIRNLTIKQNIVPIFLGSAYKNTGVQLLMDGVTSYLPAPSERGSIYKCFGKDFAGKVFKVMHDKQRGALSLVRVLNGTLKKGDKVTTSNGNSEVIQRIYEPLADEYREINDVSQGNVGICAGLKTTSTGDLLMSSMKSLNAAQEKLESKALEKALAQLHREDPSFRVSYDDTTMQTVLGGMGELHLEIIKSRILSEYKIEADLGPLQIAYKESIQEPIRDTFELKKDIAGSAQEVTIEMSLVMDKTDEFNLDTHPEAAHALAAIHPKYIKCIRKAVQSALLRGPLVGGTVVDTQVILHQLVLGRRTAESLLMSATAQCIQKLLRKTGCRLLEPLMSIQIIMPGGRLSVVLGDLSKRRAEIQEVVVRGENRIVHAIAPLAELGGYSSKVRISTSGTASMSMQPCGYVSMTEDQQTHAIRRTQGLE
ncbi:ribosome-releasing factor 2, mitochondrial isoform X2 [Sitodiplosis mosellana]|uniref:ribosome-releasing factor 2, mitochondrial isoform X2 n=1 Tax=Sitodiplosis mosellana TaxID=263140 RepID=UPI0024437426|nr:ribosome-releasing factor 2, mitochondrial isoform X2 [Sitodiplosis mosellana]